jgi:hypothetical protein
MSDKKTTTKQIAASSNADTVPTEVIEALGGAPIPPPPAPAVRPLGSGDVTLGQPATHRAGPIREHVATRPRRDRQAPAGEGIADAFRVPINPGIATAESTLREAAQAATAALAALTALVACGESMLALDTIAERDAAASLGIDSKRIGEFIDGAEKLLAQVSA